MLTFLTDGAGLGTGVGDGVGFTSSGFEQHAVINKKQLTINNFIFSPFKKTIVL